jgi:hypothetical protein
MSDLKKAAEAWDKAEREGRLNPPAPAPDTRPRNSLTGQPVPITVKFTIGKGQLHNPYPRRPF